MWTCEECGTEFNVPDDVEIGELVECPNCAVEYEVKSVRPARLTVFEEDEK
jgi:lysine biosynthesis protein LysW